MVLRSPFPLAPCTPVPFVAHVGARGCVHCSARPLLQQEHCMGGKLLLGAFTLGFCQIPAGISLGDAAKPPGCREAAWCRRSPYKPRRSANPALPTTIPPPAPFFPALLADNATSVPDLKGALSGGCRCRGSPRIGGGPVAPAPLWDRGRLGAWGSKRSLLCLRVTKGVPVCLPPLLTCIIREPFIVGDCSG